MKPLFVCVDSHMIQLRISWTRLPTCCKKPLKQEAKVVYLAKALKMKVHQAHRVVLLTMVAQKVMSSQVNFGHIDHRSRAILEMTRYHLAQLHL